MVFDLDSTHKKPYEPLIIGQFEILTDENTSTGCSTPTKQCNDRNKNFSEKDTNKKKIDESSTEILIPENQIICSVPCSLHSRKPPLNGMKFQSFWYGRIILTQHEILIALFDIQYLFEAIHLKIFTLMIYICVVGNTLTRFFLLRYFS